MAAEFVSPTHAPIQMRDMNDRYAPVPGVLVQHVGDGAVVYSVRDQCYFALNETAAVVWTALEHGGSDLGTIVAVTKATFPDAPDAELCSDVAELLDELHRLGIVQHFSFAAA